jgi:FixJ family two-component response regulator
VANADPVIAVVDDESRVRTMLGRVLRVVDYRVAMFACGEDFLNSLTGRLPACVILDVHMPGLSGFDVRSRMHSMRVDVPVILITASDDCGLDRLAAEAGAACLLRKPFSSEQLLEAVGIAVGSDPTEPDATDIAQ